jgi:hypothetical protein
MAMASQVATGARVEVCQRKVARTANKGEKVECVFGDGSSMLMSRFLASFVCPGDVIRFPLALASANAENELYICNGSSRSGRHDVCQARIGYAHLGQDNLTQAVKKIGFVTNPVTAQPLARIIPRRALGKSSRINGAEGGSRTPTALRPQDPKSCASASSATSAVLPSIAPQAWPFGQPADQALRTHD